MSMRQNKSPLASSLRAGHRGVSPASATTLLLIALGSTWGCKKPEAAPETAAVSVQAEKAERKDLTEYISGDAVLSPVAESALVAKISSPVKRFTVQRGDHVHKGQLLAVLENADLAAAVTDSKGSLTQAQAAYEASVQAQIPEDQQKAQLDVAQTKAQLDLAKGVADSRKRLVDQGAIPRRDYDTASAAYVQATAAFQIAEQHLASLKAVSQKAAIASATGALASARGKYEGAAAGLGYSELRSPIDGVVTDRPLFAGEMAQAGQAVVTVMDTSSLLAKVHLSQTQAQRLKVGADAVLTIPGVDRAIKGKISLVSPALDTGSTTLEVWVKIANRDGTLKAGTPAHVQIAAQTLKNVVTVPNEAIVKSKTGENAVVEVGADSVAKVVAVKLGVSDGHDTQVADGVKEGDQVVTTGAFGLDDGTKVTLAPATEDGADKPSAGKGEKE